MKKLLEARSKRFIVLVLAEALAGLGSLPVVALAAVAPEVAQGSADNQADTTPAVDGKDGPQSSASEGDGGAAELVPSAEDAGTAADASLSEAEDTQGASQGEPADAATPANAAEDPQPLATQATSAATPSYDAAGNLRHGWTRIGGKWYYFDDAGYMQYGWLAYRGHNFYLDEADGHEHIGWSWVNGSLYYFNSLGIQLYGWQKINGIWCYLDLGTGSAAQGWRRLSGNWYWFDNGVMHTGWLAEGDKYYYLMPTYGVRISGWKSIGGLWYYFQPADNDAMTVGWLPWGKTRYYFDEDGSMAYGARRIDGEVYLFAKSGKSPARGMFVVTKRYFSDGAGKALRNQWVEYGGGRVYCCADGIVRNAEYVADDGEVYAYSSVTGEKLVGWAGVYDPALGDFKTCYYDRKTGARVTGETVIGNATFEFDEVTGALITEQGTVSAYIDFLVRTAGDDSHGYDQAYRLNQYGDYDCSSLVITGLENAGIATGTATYTGNMRGGLTRAGDFELYPYDATTRVYLAPGDILLREYYHVATYLGENTIVHAWMNENSGAVGGAPGDQTGGELMIEGIKVHPEPWDYILRHNSVYQYLNQ